MFPSVAAGKGSGYARLNKTQLFDCVPGSVLPATMARQLLELVNSFRLSASQDVGLAFKAVIICAGLFLFSAVKGNFKYQAIK